MRALIIQLLVLVLLIISTSYIFNHVSSWLAFVLPLIYILFFNFINKKIDEKFS